MTQRLPSDADTMQQKVAAICSSGSDPECMLSALNALEPAIIHAWDCGLTSVKPVYLMTDDDLVS